MVASSRAVTRAALSEVQRTPALSRPLTDAIFRALNGIVEPLARGGCLSPDIWPTGLILLETTGRRTGRTHRVPVLAMSADGHLIVRTIRGERSSWFKNLRANPDIAYWSGGRKTPARAFIHTPGEQCATEMLPPGAGLAVAAVGMAVEMLGWRFAVLVPQ